ncbi:porin [soil metagenome]
MKRIFLPVATLFLASTAYAQSNVQIYGIMDTTIRYSTNETVAGGSKVQLGDGHLTGSRLGFQGTEDLGGGLKAIYNLESGILPDTGALGAGGGIFGRNSSVGLTGDFGSIKFGRMFNTGHDMIGSYEPMAVPNLGLVGFQAQYTTTRFDNMIKYNGTFGDFSVGAGYAFGEAAGDTRNGAKYGVSLAYKNGPLRVGGAYQVRNTVTTYYGTTVPVSDSTLMTVGGTYDIGDAKLYLGYTDHKLDAANRKNRVVYTGLKYAITPVINFIGQIDYDKLTTATKTGNRYTSSAMVLYSLSKRTELYVEGDYTTLSGGWTTLASTSAFVTPFFGNDKRTGISLGVRHKF